MLKTKWVGKNPEELSELISDSVPIQSTLTYNFGTAASTRNIKSVAFSLLPQITGTRITPPRTTEPETPKQYKARLNTVALNLEEMVAEGKATDFILLQNVPTDDPARADFIAALNNKLGSLNWEMANEAPVSSVLTIYNSNLYELKDPKFTRPEPNPPEPHNFSLFNRKNVDGQQEPFLMANIAFGNDTNANTIIDKEKEYRAFYRTLGNYRDDDGLVLLKLSVLLGGSLGQIKHNTLDQDRIKISKPGDNTVKNTAYIYHLDLQLGGINTSATALNDFNRRDAAIYPGLDGFKGKDGMWGGEHIIQVWASTPGFHEMSSCENYKFNKDTLDSIKVGAVNGQKPLKIFGAEIHAGMLATEEGKGYFENICNNVVQTLKNSFPTKPVTANQLPAEIRLAVPVQWGDPNEGHFNLLSFTISVDSEELARLINGDTLIDAPKALKDCINHRTTATLVDSGLEHRLLAPDVVEDDSTRAKKRLRAGMEVQINSVLGLDGHHIRTTTPFLQRGFRGSDDSNIDCGPITAGQGCRFLNGEKFFKVEKKFNTGNALTKFPKEEFFKWEANTPPWHCPPEDRKRKEYAEESARLSLGLRRKFLQDHGVGANDENVVEVKGTKNLNKGYPTKGETAAMVKTDTRYKTLVNQFGYTEQNGSVFSQKDSFGKSSSIITANYDKSKNELTLVSERESADVAQLMALKLKAGGYNVVEINVGSPKSVEIYRRAFENEGFNPNCIKICVGAAKSNAPAAETHNPEDFARKLGMPS